MPVVAVVVPLISACDTASSPVTTATATTTGWPDALVDNPSRAPYGVAGNGILACHDGGDILSPNPQGQDSRVLVGGPEDDGYPDFSNDGTGPLDATITSPRPEGGPTNDNYWSLWSPKIRVTL